MCNWSPVLLCTLGAHLTHTTGPPTQQHRGSCLCTLISGLLTVLLLATGQVTRQVKTFKPRKAGMAVHALWKGRLCG